MVYFSSLSLVDTNALVLITPLKDIPTLHIWRRPYSTQPARLSTASHPVRQQPVTSHLTVPSRREVVHVRPVGGTTSQLTDSQLQAVSSEQMCEVCRKCE